MLTSKAKALHKVSGKVVKSSSGYAYDTGSSKSNFYKTRKEAKAFGKENPSGHK